MLAFASLVLTLGIGEATIRMWGWSQGFDYRLRLRALRNPEQLPAAIWAAATPLAAWRRYPPLRPGVRVLAVAPDFSTEYRVNSHGLRDEEYSYERQPGITRVLVVGDSFTFGVGVPFGERFADVPERRLGNLEVIDMGVPGYGIDNVLLSYLAEGRRYRPDAVFVFIHLAMTRRHLTGIYANGRVELPESATSGHDDPAQGTVYLRYDDPFLHASHPYLEWSQLFCFTWYRTLVWRFRRDGHEASSEPPTPLPRRRRAARVRDHDVSRRARTRAILASLADACRQSEAKLIVVNIDEHVRMDYLGAIPGIAYYDVSADLFRRGRTHTLRFTYDRHYNPDTHAFIGERLTQILRTELGVPPP